MKKRGFAFIGILFVYFSCTTTENEFLNLDNTTTTIIQNEQNRSSAASEIVSSFADSPESETVPLNEIIIKYQPGISEDDKEVLRNEYEVINYKTCDCTDENQRYELWFMKPESEVQIETTVKVIKRENPDEVALVSPNKVYNTPMHALTNQSEGPPEVIEDPSEIVYIESTFNDDYLSRIVPFNNGITVAVLDTGIDTNQVGFIGNFLYNSASNGDCNEASGRDFVNNDNNTYDDNPFLHGTAVAYAIHNQLINSGIEYQILPIKVVDYDGKSTFFNTLCGLEYAIKKESHLINMSLGWNGTDPDLYAMFSDLIDTTEAIIVTSAGNKNLNNDVYAHYPSNFPQDHVLSIAAAKYNLNDATLFTNFGATTVDFFAIGNKISFPLATPNTSSFFSGTSFAAAKVTGRVAEILSNDTENIRTKLRQEFGINVDYFSKPVFYMELIE